jgi:soluble lytic murein transglycosylase-like protein
MADGTDTAYLQAYATNAATQNGVPVPYFLNFLNVESSFDPNTVGAKGEQGIAQIIPAYHPGVTNPFDPFESIDYAAQTIAAYAAKFGSWSAAFATWNAGPSAVASGHIPTSTQSYVSKIIGDSAIATPPQSNTQAPGFTIAAAPTSSGTLSQAAKTFGIIAGSGLLLLAFLGMRGKGVA